ncbi:hypothetical protein P4V41_07370 [Fictibacillus nanhaiensis]|uniref:hypothetical protein n=1 Tax=Fictibacillus nanhaiensis TaxID=742169 RepID=UPI002E1E6A53|nr:hypothetical protein [Fictibacillus nanhaiensis]
MNKCTIDNCNESQYWKGFCSTHYVYFNMHGDALHFEKLKEQNKGKLHKALGKIKTPYENNHKVSYWGSRI